MPHRYFAFDTIDALARLNSVELIAAELISALPRLGFANFVFRETPVQTGNAQPIYIVDRSPPGWREAYVAEGLYKTDHVVRYGRTATQPFEFEAAPYRAEEEAAACKYLSAAASYANGRKGVVVPTPSWRTRCAASAVLRRDHDADPAAIQTAEMMLLYAAYRLRAIISPEEASDPPRLSPREREALQWTAMGKTAWEIGEILHISEGVVNKFIANAMTKLDAVSKPQAVAKAIRFGEIDC